jgi:uncharacterized protein (UPF0332 family)
VTPELSEHLDKARECLKRAKIILDAGVGEDAGRDAYLAGFHAVQALILARTGKVAKNASRRAAIVFSAGEVRDGPSGIFAVSLSDL